MTAALAEPQVTRPAPADVASPARAKYRPDVDGLRAVAVLSVLFYHSGVSWLSGGYVGVDVFFVISGFVIATKLVEEIEENKFSISNFYVRRIRRIIPALAFTILLSYAAALFFFLPNAMHDFARSVVATCVFLSNLYFWKNSGYFETAAHDRPLLHTWSLSIEEQFYIVIPIALWLLMTWVRRWTFATFALAAAASLALSIYMTDRGPTANFFLLPTRAWELLLGVLVALAPWRPPSNRLVRELIAAAGLGLILWSVAAYSAATPFPGLSALAPTLGTAALIYLGKAGGATAVARGLSVSPMVAVGLISYSLYLAHWPIIVFARYALLRDLQGVEVVGVVGASFVLAVVSYRFVETPFRRPSRPASRPRLFAVTAGVLAGLTALGLVGISTRGFAALRPDFQPPAATATAGPDHWLTGRCFLENQDPSAWAGDLCVRTKGASRAAILWGDSFAAHYVPGLIANQHQLSRNVVQYTFAGCPPILSYRSYARPGCHGFNARILEIAARYGADTIILSARWDQLRQRGLGGLAETVTALQARGLKVYVLGQSPMFAFGVDVLDYRGAGRRPSGDAAWLLSFSPEDNARLQGESAGASFIDPLPAFCRSLTCTYRTVEGELFGDYGHFSELGSDLAVRSYFPLYERSGRGTKPSKEAST